MSSKLNTAIAVETEAVEARVIVRPVRAVGTVMHDESRLTDFAMPLMNAFLRRKKSADNSWSHRSRPARSVGSALVPARATARRSGEHTMRHGVGVS
jgi:hypothetical protein